MRFKLCCKSGTRESHRCCHVKLFWLWRNKCFTHYEKSVITNNLESFSDLALIDKSLEKVMRHNVVNKNPDDPVYHLSNEIKLALLYFHKRGEKKSALNNLQQKYANDLARLASDRHFTSTSSADKGKKEAYLDCQKAVHDFLLRLELSPDNPDILPGLVYKLREIKNDLDEKLKKQGGNFSTTLNNMN